MNKRRTIFRAPLAMLVIALLMLRMASPYLHTHTSVHGVGEGVSTPSVCAACELESTPVSDAADPIAVPAQVAERFFSYPHNISDGYSSRENLTLTLRGPPSNS